MKRVKEKISIIIPAFNEENNIISTLEKTIKVFDDLKHDYEIIVVDDGSIDNTFRAVESYLKKYNGKVKIKRYEQNRGKGFALKYGFNLASGSYDFFLDADSELHPDHFSKFFKAIKMLDTDAVVGSKRHKNSIINTRRIRNISSNGYYRITKFLFKLPIEDTQTGVKLFRYEALEYGIPKTTLSGYVFDLELLVILNKSGYNIVESPVSLTPKRNRRRIALKDIISILWDTITIFFNLYLKKKY